MKAIGRLLCSIGWHKVDKSRVRGIDGDPFGFIKKSQCERCGFEGLLDSNGDLF